MTNFVVNKNLITEKVLSILKPDFTPSELEKAKFKFWWHISGGLRLTSAGTEFFNKADIEYFEFKFNKTLMWQGHNLLKMDKHILAPYFLSPKESLIRIYDGRIASLVSLYGDVIEYVNSLETKVKDLS